MALNEMTDLDACQAGRRKKDKRSNLFGMLRLP